jgi:hypothetical protein
MKTDNMKEEILKGDYDQNNNNSSSRYMEDTRKHYLLASNKESLQTLFDNQEENLTRVLIELKSEYNLLTRESEIKKKLIEEYNKKINMIQSTNSAYEKKQEIQKEESNSIKNGIDIKKIKKNEEIYNRKTLEKLVDKLSKDLFIIQKQIVENENESQLLDKKKERAKLDENIIKEKGNQVFSQIEEQTQRNIQNKKENDLQIQYYETVIKQKSMFIQFTDDRKERQKKIEQQAKNDNQDKQEVEKRRKLQLLLLYNKYLKKRMNDQLKRYDELEYVYNQIRNICGTQDISAIINFAMLRNKKYNYSVQSVDEKEAKINKIKKDIKKLKLELVRLKNENVVAEKDSKLIKVSLGETGLNKGDLDMIKKENDKNQELLLLGQKYNEVDLAYNQVLTNIKSMQEYDMNHPLDINDEKLEEDENDKNGEINPENKNKKNNKKIKLTEEEEDNIEGYKKLLEKILKVFNILYLCKSKTEFINLMREKGYSQQQTENKPIVIKPRKRSKKGTKRSTRRFTKIKIDLNESRKNDDGEENDSSVNDADKNILNKFMKEQQKEIDDYINIRKVEIKKPNANK